MQAKLHRAIPTVLLASTLLLALPALGQVNGTSGLPLWEAGAVVVGLSQQAYPGASQTVNRALPLPFFIYRGEYLRADRDGAALHAIKTERFELDIGFSGALGTSAKNIDARNGMPDSGTLIEFGPRAKWHLGTGPGNGKWRTELAVRGVFDVSDKFSSKGLAIEPALIFENRTHSGWGYSTALGLVFGNQRLSDTFYGVAPIYAKASRPSYQAEAGLIDTFVSVSGSRNITPDLRVIGFARITSVNGSANTNSPLVKQNTGTTIGLGLIYTFARSSTFAAY